MILKAEQSEPLGDLLDVGTAIERRVTTSSLDGHSQQGCFAIIIISLRFVAWAPMRRIVNRPPQVLLYREGPVDLMIHPMLGGSLLSKYLKEGPHPLSSLQMLSKRHYPELPYSALSFITIDFITPPTPTNPHPLIY